MNARDEEPRGALRTHVRTYRFHARRPWHDRRPLQRLAVLLLLPLLAACPKDPEAGAKQYQARSTLTLPRGLSVNVAGGNLMLTRTDISLDTFVGTFGIGPTFNSTTNSWHFNIETSYVTKSVPTAQGGTREVTTFTDPLGTTFSVGGLGDARRVKGTRWVKLAERKMKTLGGLVYEFNLAGDLAALYWHGSVRHSKLTFTTSGATTTIRQCLNFNDCKTIYTVARVNGRIVRVTGNRAGSGEATYGWDAGGRLAYARSAFDSETGNGGTSYTSTDTSLYVESPERESLIATFENQPVVGLHGRTTQVKYHGAGDPTWTFSYGKLKGSAPVQFWTRTTNALGDQSVHYYDQQGRTIAIDHPGGESESFVWTLPLGRFSLASHTRVDGQTQSWVETLDNLTTTVPGARFRKTYAGYGEAVGSRQSPGTRPVTKTEVYDSGWVTTSRTTWDVFGHLTSQENGEGETNSYEYDTTHGGLAKATGPDGTTYLYDDYGDHGRATSVKLQLDGETAQSTVVFDEVGNVLRPGDVTPDSPGTYALAYDSARNRVIYDLAGSEEIHLTHRSDGQITQITRPWSGSTTWEYDALGRSIARVERSGGVEFMRTKLEYDLLGRETGIHQNNGMRSETTLDHRGRIVQQKSCRKPGLGGTCGSNAEASATFQRNALGQLVAIIGSGGLAMNFTYDSLGRLSSTTDFHSGPDDVTVVGYDARNRIDVRSFTLSDETDLGAVILTYDNADRLTEAHYVREGSVEQLLANSFSASQLRRQFMGENPLVIRTYVYDSGRLKSTSTSRFGGTGWPRPEVQVLETSDSLDWTMGGIWNGQVLSGVTSAVTIDGVVKHSTETWKFQRNGPHRRLEQFYSDEHLPGGNLSGQAYTNYDALSNIERFMYGNLEDTWVSTFEDSHTRLARIDGTTTGATLTYEYDAGGFVTRRGDDQFTWTTTGALASYGPVGASAGTIEFACDGLGRPTSRSVTGAPAWTKTFRFGGMVQEDPSGDRKLDLGFVVVDTAGPGRLFRHLDHRGNVKFLTDESGNAVTHYHYDAYGLTNIDGDANADHERRFAGGLDLGEVTVLGARVLDPLTARFLSPDPIYNDVNQYSYTLGNPVELWDPGGDVAVLIVAYGVYRAAWHGLQAYMVYRGVQDLNEDVAEFREDQKDRREKQRFGCAQPSRRGCKRWKKERPKPRNGQQMVHGGYGGGGGHFSPGIRRTFNAPVIVVSGGGPNGGWGRGMVSIHEIFDDIAITN